MYKADGWETMLQAAVKGDADAVEAFFDREPSYWWNFTDEDGASLLDIAVRFQHKELTMMLLDNGAEADSDSLGFLDLTPLYLATRDHDGNKVRALLESGADPNAKDVRGNTCLHMSSALNYQDVIRLLLEAGASVEARNGKGRTPLHIAAMHSSLQAAQLLLTAGAAVSARDAGNDTPLNLTERRSVIVSVQPFEDEDTYNDESSACEAMVEFLGDAQAKTFQLLLGVVENGDTASVKRMLEREDVAYLTETSAADTTPLHTAAEQGNDEIVHLLLGAGADVDSEAENGDVVLWGPTTPLVVATQSSTIRILLDAGAALPETFNDFYLPKSLSRSSFSARTLLDAGISSYQRDGFGAALLHAATREADAFGIKALLAAGADVNARDDWQATPLHYAGFCGKDVIPALLQAGAEIEARNDAGETPLIACLQQLSDAQDDGDLWGSDYVALLLAAGADFNVHDKDGNTPLHWIARIGEFDAEVAGRVLRQTIDVSATNRKGETPLGLAMSEGGPHIVSLLLDAGAESGESVLGVEEEVGQSEDMECRQGEAEDTAMDIGKIAQQVYKKALPEIKAGKATEMDAIMSAEDVVYACARELVHEEMDWDKPQNSQLVPNFVDNPALYSQLQQLNYQLTYDQYSQFTDLFNG